MNALTQMVYTEGVACGEANIANFLNSPKCSCYMCFEHLFELHRLYLTTLSGSHLQLLDTKKSVLNR